MKVLLIGNQSSTIILFRKLTMDNNEGNFNKIKKIGAIPLSYSFSRSGINPISDFFNTFFWQGK
ncbi:hypothetical protein [Escherichia coli]|uniref:hypothetical protein n=1 Tax=Escherichia coli TaxID=562 RepID=UPI000B1B318F|nr:hypothetical protein [Escherichia coli]